MNDQSRPEKSLIFAHRGASAEAMENTPAAFDKALQYAIDGIETDVQLSRDAVAVLWHDRFLNKIGLADQSVDSLDYAQLETLGPTQNDDEHIVALETFLTHYHQRCRLLVEVKNGDWEPVAQHEMKMRQVINHIKSIVGGDDNSRILVSSFNLPSLIYTHRQAAHIPLVYNLEDDQSATDVQQALDDCTFLYGYCLPIAWLDQNLVNLLRAQEKCIAVYTCNTDEEIDKALQLGVDILISDLPQKALDRRANMSGNA